MKIAIDVMNGDNSPSSNINGSLKYLIKNPNDTIFLVGKKSILQAARKKFKSKNIKNFKLVYAEDTISDDDSMTRLFKNKPDSSLIKSIKSCSFISRELVNGRRVESRSSSSS